jgi:hypothetical protein
MALLRWQHRCYLVFVSFAQTFHVSGGLQLTMRYAHDHARGHLSVGPEILNVDIISNRFIMCLLELVVIVVHAISCDALKQNVLCPTPQTGRII